MRCLPAHWVEKIFQKLHGRYGTLFSNKFSTGVVRKDDGKDEGIENAKLVWAEDLAGFYENPEAIAHALESTDPKYPPSSFEFAALCRSAASRLPSGPALPPPPPLGREEAAKRMDDISSRIGRRDPFAPSLDWAKRLRERYLSGEKLIHCQIDMASGALGEVWKDGKINPTLEAMQ